MRTYLSKDLEVEQMKEDVAREWEEHKHEASPDLVLLINADLHSGVSEQQAGKETLRLTQASLLEATGGLLLSDDACQTLIVGVRTSLQVRSRVPPGFHFLCLFPGTYL